MSRWWTEPLPLLVQPPPGTPAPARLPAALAELGARLDAAAHRRGTRLRLLLRDDLLRWRVVPWRADFSHGPARESLLHQAFVEAYGDAARDWQVQADAPRWGEASLACALPADDARALHDALRSRGLVLAALQPLLVHAIDRLPAAERGGDGWWVLLHDGGVTLLNARRGVPQHLRSLPGHDDSPAALLLRETVALGLEEADTPTRLIDVRSDAAAPLPWPLPAGWTHRRLQVQPNPTATVATAAAAAAVARAAATQEAL